MPSGTAPATGYVSGDTAGWQAAFIDALPDPVLALDVISGRIVSANAAAVRLFGYAHESLVGMHFSEVLPPLTANANTPVGRRFPLTGHIAESQIFCDAAGAEVPLDTLVMSLRDGKAELAVLHLRDARPREAALRARHDAERQTMEIVQSEGVARAIDRYMSHVSHEMKTPLAVILSSASMLERYYLRLSDVKREEHFTRITSQVRYLTDFLDNLRFLSHLESGQVDAKYDDVDAAAMLQEIISGYSAHPQQPLFDVRVGGHLLGLVTDAGLLQRILGNLIANAVKYGPTGGTVQVSLTRRPDAFEIRVSDHGPGLPNEYRAKAFEVFRRGRSSGDSQGGGLGLAIAARCVALLGGQITFETAPDAGTTFSVVLPVDR